MSRVPSRVALLRIKHAAMNFNKYFTVCGLFDPVVYHSPSTMTPAREPVAFAREGEAVTCLMCLAKT